MASKAQAEAQKALGNAAFKAKDFTKAIHYYTNAIKADGENHVYYSNRAACFFGLKKWSESADDAQMCIELKPTFIKGYIHLAKAELKQGLRDDCEYTVQLGAAKCQGDVDVPRLLAVLEGLGAVAPEAPPAKPKAKTPVKKPEVVEVPDSSSEEESEEDSDDEEEEEEEEEEPASPAEQAVRLKEQGNEQYKKGLYRDALRFYSAAIEANEQAPPGEQLSAYYGNRAACYLMIQEHTKAIDDCLAGLKLDPGNTKLATRCVTAYVALGKFDEAVAIANQVFEECDESAEPAIQEQLNKVEKVQQKLQEGDNALEAKGFGNALVCFQKSREMGLSAFLPLDLRICRAYAGTRNFSELGKVWLVCFRMMQDLFSDVCARFSFLKKL
jgi:tetratricopeptide (TPR) repeat protein